jgi:hypothetical protein
LFHVSDNLRHSAFGSGTLYCWVYKIIIKSYIVTQMIRL